MCKLNVLSRRVSDESVIVRRSVKHTVCFKGKSSSGNSFNPTMMCSFGASSQEPVGTRLAPVPSYSSLGKMLKGERSTLTEYPASTSFLAMVGVIAVRCSNGFVSARMWRIVPDILRSCGSVVSCSCWNLSVVRPCVTFNVVMPSRCAGIPI